MKDINDKIDKYEDKTNDVLTQMDGRLLKLEAEMKKMSLLGEGREE